MSTSPFMDDYSEDYSDYDDDYYFVPTATTPLQVRAPQVKIHIQSNELQNLIIDQHEDISESVHFNILPELEVETAKEGGGMEQSIFLAEESCFDLEAQAEPGVAAALEAETTVEELIVEPYFDLEAQAETVVAAALEAETVVEELTVESYFGLEAQVETGLPASLETETVLEEGDVIESESLETVEADIAVEIVQRMIEEFIYEAVESEFDPQAEDAVKEPISDVEHEAHAVAPEAETAVEGDVISESIYKGVESDYDLQAKAMVEEEDDMVEEEDDIVEGEVDFVEEPLESDNNLQEEAEALIKALIKDGGAMEESIYEPLQSNSDLQADEPEALAEVSIERTTFKAQEPDSDLEPGDLIDEQSDSVKEEFDLNEEWDSYAEESDMDSSDSDLTEVEEDDVVVSYLKSSTTIRNKAWNFLVPASALAWAKLPVTDTTTLEDSSLLQESFLGCSPVLMLQECGHAVMNVIETLMCELLRIRSGLRRVLGALFCKSETTKEA